MEEMALGEDVFELLMEVLSQVALELIQLTPKIFISIIVIVLSFLVVKVLNTILSKLLGFAKLDELLKEASGVSMPFSVERLLTFLVDLGVALIALYSLVSLFLGAEYVRFMNDVLAYGGKLVSVVAMSLIILAAFNTVIGRVRMESRLKIYTRFVVLLIITAMLIDVTALSPQTKAALSTGLAIGVGAFIGVFAVWFFFHEYLDRLIAKKGR